MITDIQARLEHALKSYVIPGLAFGGDGFNSITRQHQVLGTGFKESGYVHTRQLGGGPALGFFQMEPATHSDILKNFIAYRPDLAKAVYELTGSHCPDAEVLIANPVYAAFMSGVQYLRSPLPLPAPFDAFGQACLWKRAYNGPGAGTVADAVQYFRTANEVF